MSKYPYIDTFLARERQSALFKEVVQSISKLIESEGLDTAERAVAEALAIPKSKAFAKRHGVKLSDSTPCLKRVAGGRHGGRLEHYTSQSCRAPRADHPTLWLKDGDAYAYVSEPYYLDTEDIGKTYEVAKTLGLDVTISADSPYFPGKSLHVLYTRSRTHKR